MRKKLFTAAMLFIAYCLVAVLHSSAAGNGLIAKPTHELVLTNTSALLHQDVVHATSSSASTRSFIDPIPDPPFPRPKPPQA